MLKNHVKNTLDYVLFFLFIYLKFVTFLRFQTARTSLMPGILKTIGQNKAHPKPIKVHCSFSVDHANKEW
jgi:hypothetical protein